jgi:hypothetical protein
MCMNIEGSNELGEEALAVRVEAIPRRLVQTTNQCWVGRCRATPKEQARYSKNKHAPRWSQGVLILGMPCSKDIH